MSFKHCFEEEKPFSNKNDLLEGQDLSFPVSDARLPLLLLWFSCFHVIIILVLPFAAVSVSAHGDELDVIFSSVRGILLYIINR